MKAEINHPAKSKINLAASVQSLANIGVYFLNNYGFIPDAAVVDALVVANTASAGLIFVFRTWFTKP